MNGNSREGVFRHSYATDSDRSLLLADYAPRRLRATMIMATFTGAPLGGFLAGQIAGLQQSLVAQTLQAEEQGIAGEGRETLVG